MEMQIDIRLISAVYLGLILFGIGYNQAVASAGRRGWLEGFTWLAVVVGVFLTLALLAIVSWQGALIGLVGFACSGLPMAAGAIWRYIQAREEGQKYDRQAAGVAERRPGSKGSSSGGSDEGDPLSETDRFRGTKFYRD